MVSLVFGTCDRELGELEPTTLEPRERVVGDHAYRNEIAAFSLPAYRCPCNPWARAQTMTGLSLRRRNTAA